MKTTKTILLVRFASSRVQLIEVTDLAWDGRPKHVTYDILQDRKVIKSRMWSKWEAVLLMRDIILNHFRCI